nr:hypothetical protein [Pyrobaculum sp.]
MLPRSLLVMALAAWAVLLTAQGPPGELFCASAGELGLAGEPSTLMFSVFERGSWRPAAAYIEPENVTFLLVPLLTRNDTDISKAAVPGRLPPPVLRNETVVCFEAAPGRPAVDPPAPGLLIVAEKRVAKYHVFVARAEDVENPANFTLALPNKAEGKRPDKVELADQRPPRGGKKKQQPEAEVQSVNSLSYWAAFKLYKLTSASLAPGACLSTTFDVPEGTRQAAVVLTGGTTPGTYQYTITNTLSPSNRWSGTVTVPQGSPQTAVQWLPSGRAQYSVTICNKNSGTASVQASALVYATNSQYYRNDVYVTPDLVIPLWTCNYIGCAPTRNWHLVNNAYLATPGFYVDAAASILLEIYLRAHKSSLTSDTVNVYWGPLYLGSLTGSPDPSDSNYLEFRGTLSVAQSLYWYMLPTYGIGGVISIGPLKITSTTPSATLRVHVSVLRPVDLAAADDGLYNYLTNRFKAHALVLTERSFVAELTAQRNGASTIVTVVTRPLDLPVDPKSAYTTVRFYVKILDSSLQPVRILESPAEGPLYTQGVSSTVLESLPFVSALLSLYDLAKSTIDALKRNVASFPVIGFITIALDAFVTTASASYKVWLVDDYTLGVAIYTGWYNDPLTMSKGIAIDYGPSPPTYIYVSRIEAYVRAMGVDYPGLSMGLYYPLLSVNGISTATAVGTIRIPSSNAAVSFPYRTLTCGAQESSVRGNMCINDYFR